MKIVIRKYTILFVLLWSSIFLFTSCEEDISQEPIIDSCNPGGVAGELQKAEYFASYTPEQVQTYLGLLDAPEGPVPEYSVDAYQVLYSTLDKNKELVNASGVMFIPQGLDTLDVLSIQHGTVFERAKVGSVNPIYAMVGMIAATNGYLVTVPDYLGLGSSQLLHPYLHAELSANAVVDMIRAARKYACQTELVLSDDLFLAGYSEGGYVTLATHEALETNYAEEFQLTAVAPMAGPYDLVTSIRSMFKQKIYNNPSYLAYIVAAYNDIYEWDRLDEIFQEPYSNRIPSLFNGNYGRSEINDSLTSNIDSLFVADFKAAFLAGEDIQIENTLMENSLLGWGPIAPVRLFHGTADNTVYYENSVTAFESLTSNGGLDVSLVPLVGANHGSAAFPSYYLALEWFDSLRTVQ